MRFNLDLQALSIAEKRKLVTDNIRRQNIAEKAGIDSITVSSKGMGKICKWEIESVLCDKNKKNLTEMR